MFSVLPVINDNYSWADLQIITQSVSNTQISVHNVIPIYNTELVLNSAEKPKILLLKALCEHLKAVSTYCVLTPDCLSDTGLCS
jgi:NifB/MoaA-like Fe-S oxidoreductase